jgi:hypothetical protein
MKPKLVLALWLSVALVLVACSRDGPPSSLFNTSGYHVRGEKVYFLPSFPSEAFDIEAGAATFKAFGLPLAAAA